MKKLIINSLVLLITLLSVNSCSSFDEDNVIEISQIKKTSQIEKSGATSRWYIFHATWSSWGRTSLNCAGFGLCNYSSCWFCNQTIAVQSDNYGTFVVDSSTNNGYLLIELNPNKPQQLEAINNRETLYVDQNITRPKDDTAASSKDNSVTILAGTYAFDDSIGTRGGYQVNAIVR